MASNENIKTVPVNPYGGGAEHRPAIPAVLQAYAVCPKPERRFPL
jgi:hypothetical protein